MYIAEYNRSREWKLLRTSIIHLRGVSFFFCYTCMRLPEQGSILPETGCDNLSGPNQGLQASLRCSHTHTLNAPWR